MSSLSTYPSPRLPWEVLERIIGHSSNRTILNCSLTCRDLRPHSLCLLITDVKFHSRGKLLDFCDFLTAKPHLKPLVRSIVVHPDQFAPNPLLRMLPNLSEIKFAETTMSTTVARKPIVLHKSTLAGCQFPSARIQSLSLANLHFRTPIQFLHVLSTFTSIKHLVCSDVWIKPSAMPGPNGWSESAPQTVDVAKRRLAQKLRLRTVSPPASPCWEDRR